MRSGIFSKSGSFGMKAPPHTSAHINLTPMIDMMVVLMIFLVKTFSTDPQFLTNTQDIKLVQTTSETIAPQAPVLIIGKDGVLLDGKVVVAFAKGLDTLKSVNTQGVFPELKQHLEQLAEKTKQISKSNTSVNFTGELILQTDREIPFELLRPILRSAGLAGYHDFKFAGIYSE